MKELIKAAAKLIPARVIIVAIGMGMLAGIDEAFLNHMEKNYQLKLDLSNKLVHDFHEGIKSADRNITRLELENEKLRNFISNKNFADKEREQKSKEIDEEIDVNLKAGDVEKAVELLEHAYLKAGDVEKAVDLLAHRDEFWKK